MTFQTPAHGERLCLEDHFHLVYATMTAFAAHTVVGMHGMAELGVVGELVNLDPLDGLTSGPAFTNREQLERLGPDLAMAVHTRLRGRDIRVRRVFHVCVAVLAADAQLTSMEPVTVLYRLLGCIPDVRVLGREVVPNEKYGEDATRQ